MTGGWFFRGFEIDYVDGRTVEYSQVWLVKPLPDQQSAL
jgi:hypothetical protein